MRRPVALLLLLTAAACGGPAEYDPPIDLADRAAGLARSTIIVDGHVDLPWRLYAAMDEEQLAAMEVPENVAERTEGGDFDFVRAREGGLDGPFMSIYIPARFEATGKAKAVADRVIDIVESLANEHPDKFSMATSEADVRNAHASGRVALLMGMENGSPLEGDLDNLRHFHERGIRYITLTHSKDNHISDSSFDDARTWGGLSPFGRDVVAEMNRLGIMIDISHLSDDAAHQVLDLTEAPVIASHSSCREFTPDFERNIDDALLQRVAENDGVVMINFGSTFLKGELREKSSANWEHVRGWVEANGVDPESEEARDYRRAYMKENHPGYADVTDVADHIDHVVRVAGIDHVGLGSDFDGVGDSLPEGLKDAAAYPGLIRVLLERDYSDEDIAKICSGNVFRVMRAVSDTAGAHDGTR